VALRQGNALYDWWCYLCGSRITHSNIGQRKPGTARDRS